MTPRAKKLASLLVALTAIQLVLLGVAGWMVSERLAPDAASNEAVEAWLGG